MIAEDDDIVRKAFTEALKSEGYEVTDTPSGEQALLFLKKFQYDLVLTDYQMGAINGIDVLKAAKDINPKYKVIIVTAYGTYSIAKEATDSWKDQNSLVLYKTMSVDNLLSSVRDLLDGKNMNFI